MILHPSHTSCVKSYNSKISMLWAGLHIFSSTQRHRRVSSFWKLHWLTPTPVTSSGSFNWMWCLVWTEGWHQTYSWEAGSLHQCVCRAPPLAKDTHPEPSGSWIKSHITSTHRSACSQSTQQVSLTVPGEVLSFWAKQLKIARWHTLYVHACVCVCVYTFWL